MASPFLLCKLSWLLFSIWPTLFKLFKLLWIVSIWPVLFTLQLWPAFLLHVASNFYFASFTGLSSLCGQPFIKLCKLWVVFIWPALLTLQALLVCLLYVASPFYFASFTGFSSL
jgi:hypothetical protein